jgi:hypothetical protein
MYHSLFIHVLKDTIVNEAAVNICVREFC